MDISYPYICASQSDLPEEALEYIDAEMVASLGQSFIKMFPQFSQSFELTSQTIEKYWNQPKLAMRQDLRRRQWLSYIVVQTHDKNLFFNLQPVFIEKEGEDFEEDHQILPDGWKELYRWFNSFCVTEENHCLMDWWNTPFRYEARLDLDDYKDGTRATRQQTEQFAKAIGCRREKLRCWLLTENEDALFINEEACDGKVFHVQGKHLDVITELKDPTKTMDEYLAHYLSGGKPADFIFVD